jgi:ribosome-associated toxin RatA of RatAB toxin-antitoxin module
MRTTMAGLGIVLMSMGTAVAGPPPPPDVTVAARDGVYHVSATFRVSQPASVAFAVLTDYEQIPRFMPDVRKSEILERRDATGTTIVEQEAVARVMMFSKRVHLVLEIEEQQQAAPRVVRFHDRCGRSFSQYEGAWTISERTDAQGQVEIAYALTAKPTFDVPEFLLTRLLKRDAQTMIDRLRTEIARRAACGGGEQTPLR